MSIWDHVKKSQKPPQPVAMEQAAEGRELRIQWDDGERTAVSARTLRLVCPCAACVDEWTHQRTVDPASIPQDIFIVDRREVGNYALGLRFSDGHQTGIFQWSLLRNPTG